MAAASDDDDDDDSGAFSSPVPCPFSHSPQFVSSAMMIPAVTVIVRYNNM